MINGQRMILIKSLIESLTERIYVVIEYTPIHVKINTKLTNFMK